MVVNIERLFSKRANRLRSSEIRELLKITQIPGMISSMNVLKKLLKKTLHNPYSMGQLKVLHSYDTLFLKE